MAELCFSRSCMSQIYHLVCTDLVLFFSFVFYHPLYLSYLVFFSPYIYKLVSFLSPLFLTSSLVLLPLIYDNFTPKLSEPGCSFLLSAFSAVFDTLSSKFAEDFQEFEVYKTVFLLDETCGFNADECEEKHCLEDVDQVLALNSGIVTTELPLIEEKKEMLHSTLEKEASNLRIGSEAVDINMDCCDNVKEHTGIVKLRVDSYDKIGRNASNFDNEGSNLGSYGSMRKEKEWKRTLACKLFEERHYNEAEGGQGMDSLWETYESDSTKSTRKDVKKKSMKKKSSDLDYNGNNADEDDDEVEMRNGHLCCLHAFKFSARKVNMGMGRTNIVKLTKALKGIGWLHLHHVKRHEKKEMSLSRLKFDQ